MIDDDMMSQLSVDSTQIFRAHRRRHQIDRGSLVADVRPPSGNSNLTRYHQMPSSNLMNIRQHPSQKSRQDFSGERGGPEDLSDTASSPIKQGFPTPSATRIGSKSPMRQTQTTVSPSKKEREQERAERALAAFTAFDFVKKSSTYTMQDFYAHTIAVSNKFIYLDDKNRNLQVVDKQTLKNVGVIDLESKGL